MKNAVLYCSLYLLLCSCQKRALSKNHLIGEWQLKDISIPSGTSFLPTQNKNKPNLHLWLKANDTFKSDQPIITSILPGTRISVTSGIWQVDSFTNTITLFAYRNFSYEYIVDKFDGDHLVLRHTYQKIDGNRAALPESGQIVYSFIKVP